MQSLPVSRVKIFADGADLDGIFALANDASISGFTTNPTLMRQSGVTDYEGFGRKVLERVTDVPVSFEVFADEPSEMARQASLISSWGSNVYVKIPVTTTTGQHTTELVRELSEAGVQLNVTALMTLDQVERVGDALAHGADSIVSVFAGRIADTGRDPIPIMDQALRLLSAHRQIELLWASPREILNVRQANDLGVHIITVTHDMLLKLASFGKDLDQFSLETVQMFHRDAQAAGFLL